MSEGASTELVNSIDPEAWKKDPDWKFWLEYFHQPELKKLSRSIFIESFSHLPRSVIYEDRQWLDEYFAGVQSGVEQKKKDRELLMTPNERAEIQRSTEQQRSLGPDGKFFEELFIRLLDQEGLFGGTFIRCTNFDDFRNGVDAVIEWDHDHPYADYPRLAVDFTVMKDIEKKQQRTFSDAKVKYFRSHFDRFAEKPKEYSLLLPRVVIQITREQLKQLAHELRESGGRESIKQHTIRFFLLEQCLDQIKQQIEAMSITAAGDENQNIQRNRNLEQMKAILTRELNRFPKQNTA